MKQVLLFFALICLSRVGHAAATPQLGQCSLKVIHLGGVINFINKAGGLPMESAEYIGQYAEGKNVFDVWNISFVESALTYRVVMSEETCVLKSVELN